MNLLGDGESSIGYTGAPVGGRIMNRDWIRSILGATAVAAIAAIPAGCGALSVGTTLVSSADAIGTIVKDAIDDEPEAAKTKKTASAALTPHP